MSQTRAIKRYNLAIPEALYKELQQLTEQQDTTMLELLKQFIRLGLWFSKLRAESPDTKFLIERNGERTEVQIIY